MPSVSIRQRFTTFRNTLSDGTRRGSFLGGNKQGTETKEKLAQPTSLPSNIKPETVSSSSTSKRRSLGSQLWGDKKIESPGAAPTERRNTPDHTAALPRAVASIKLHRIEKTDLTVNSKVGEGSFGLVLSATWVARDEKVVVKVLKPREYFDERLAKSEVTYHDIVAAFRREIRLMQDCGEHPNIVPILGKGENDTMLVMSAASMDLHKLCKKVKTDLSLQLIEKWGRDILSAISHIHERGIIHQDVKTSNILIFEDGEAKICDFGLAVRMTDDLKVNRELCTLWYRPPELIMGCRTYTPLVDEWGVGCIILEMLIGEVPLPGDTSRTCTCHRQSHINYNKDQLGRIFRLIGSPKDNEVSGLACWDHFRAWPQQEGSLSSLVHNACYERAISNVDPMTPRDLAQVGRTWTSALTHLMAHIPENRLSADQALNLPLFREKKEAQSSTLPPCPSSPASSPSPVRIPSYQSSPMRWGSPTDHRTSSTASMASTASGRSTRSARGSLDSGAVHLAQKSTSILLKLAEPVSRISSRLSRSKSRWTSIEERSSSALAIGETQQIVCD